MASIAQTAKRHGTEYICVVTMTEAFGAHSITARLARVSDLQVIKSGTTDRALKSFDDLTAVSNELARQLLPPGSYALPTALAVAPAAVASKEAPVDAPPAPAGPKECDKTYNLNELIFKIKDGFPAKLKDCSSTLAKDMLTPATFGGHKLEPKSFLTQCAVDGVKKELPEGFPNKDKIVGSLTNFMQGIMNAALAGGAVDPKKLLSAVASMDIMGLVSDVKKLAADECVVDEPYEPPAAPAGSDEDDEKKEKSSVSFGIRAGMNFSHTYAEYSFYDPYDTYGIHNGEGNYGDILGMQVGFVVDFPISDWFHLQPGLMYIQKGMKDASYSYDDGRISTITAHYIEFPLLLSLKFSVLRLNVGPYIGWTLNNPPFYAALDLGLSTGIGFDIGMFYIGTFYDYGFWTQYGVVGSDRNINTYNRTLGLNVGINL
ncbi:MAG: PorT family protein [Fibromonadales bacterium]|nr:PorT family protein [Fibromonadales bacterium]